MTFRYTALNEMWGRTVKQGDVFVVKQGSSSADAYFIAKQLRERGTPPPSYTTISTPSMSPGDTHKTANWLVERID